MPALPGPTTNGAIGYPVAPFFWRGVCGRGWARDADQSMVTAMPRLISPPSITTVNTPNSLWP
jgi:hypothetical protein